MNREEKIDEIMSWAMFDLDNDNTKLEEYENSIRAMNDEMLDDEYEGTVGEWKRSLMGNGD
jgi:hypothetical protein